MTYYHESYVLHKCTYKQLLLLLLYQVSDIQPSTYALLLTSIDGLHDEKLVYASINSETKTHIILEKNLTLPIRTLWDGVVLAYGCRGNPITTGHELSKFSKNDIVGINP